VGSQTSSLGSTFPNQIISVPFAESLRLHWKKWVELVSVITAIELVLWNEGLARLALYVVANVWVVFVAFRQGRTARELGIGARGFSESSWIMAAGAGMALAVVGMGVANGTLHILFGVKPIVLHVGAYALWALMQQFVAQSYFFLQIEALTGSSRKAVIGSGLIFGLLHIPNPVLLIVTTIGGLLFSALFCRYRNIYPLAFAHAAVALAIAVSLPNDVHRHMRVGIGYIHFRNAERPSVPIAPPSENMAPPPRQGK
jgi:membrane protease YdiL (CAAX protease family)